MQASTEQLFVWTAGQGKPQRHREVLLQPPPLHGLLLHLLRGAVPRTVPRALARHLVSASLAAALAVFL